MGIFGTKCEDDGGWIKAADAVKRLSVVFGSDAKAKEVVSERLKAGDLKTRAEFWGADSGNGSIVSENEEDLNEKNWQQLSPYFWRKGSHWEADQKRWSWSGNTFYVTHGADGKGPFERYIAIGVSFRASQIDQLLEWANPSGNQLALVKNAPGAKLSELWPHWVAELAFYIRNEEPGSISANKLIETIDARLRARDVTPLGRNTVYATASETLRLLRSGYDPE